MSRPYPAAPPQRQKIPVCETPIPTSIKKAVPFFNPREFWSWGANPVGSNCRQLDTIVEKPIPPPPLNVCTYAGFGGAGDDDGIVNLASFAFPTGIAVDSSGNVYVADSGNHKIKKIDTSGFVTTFAGTGISGFTNGTSLSASFWNPTGVAVSSNGNVYIADALNNSIRKISNGSVTTLAGNATAGSNNDTGTSASFNFPFDIALDLSENLYIADTLNNTIRFCTSTGVVTRYAGQYPGFRDGNRLDVTGAQFNNPTSVAFNPSTNTVYVTDTTNNAIRVIEGDNVSTILRDYYAPVGGSFDSQQNYYFTEQGLNRIIRYSSNCNVIFAGDGTEGFTNGLDLSSSFSFPFKVCAVSPSLAYVADNENNVIRRISTLATPVTEILNANSISPYQYISSNPANLTYSIIGAGGGGGVGCNAGGGGGAGTQFIDGYVLGVQPASTFDFLVGRGGAGGLGAPSYKIPTNGNNTILVINGQTITSEGGGAAVPNLNLSEGGIGGEGAYGGGGGFGTLRLGIGGSGSIEPGKNAYNSNGGNGGGIAAGVGGAYRNVSGQAVGGGGGGGGHGGGYGKYDFCNAFYYGAGGAGIDTIDASGNVAYGLNGLPVTAGNGSDGVIALVFTPI